MHAVLNLLKKNMPATPATIIQIKPYKNVLREMGKRKHSVKRRRALLMSQNEGGQWKGLNQLCEACYGGEKRI